MFGFLERSVQASGGLKMKIKFGGKPPSSPGLQQPSSSVTQVPKTTYTFLGRFAPFPSKKYKARCRIEKHMTGKFW